MTEFRIRQSGTRGTGIVIGLIMLAVLLFVVGGPQWAQIADEVEREEQQRANVAKILDGSADLVRMRPALEKNSKQALEDLPQRYEQGAAQEPHSAQP
jgi:hypothetical protein